MRSTRMTKNHDSNSTESEVASSRIPAVVINLERHKERREWFVSNAKRVGLDIEVISAVDAKDCRCESLIESLCGPNPTLSSAEAACFLSHRKVWQQLLDSRYQFLAIFEDDVHLSEDLAELLDSRLIPPCVDLVKLEEPCGRVAIGWRRVSPYLGRSMHRLLTRAYGSAGYIVSRRCAQRLLDMSERAYQPVDVVLFDDASPIFKEFGVVQVVPAPCTQDMNLNRRTPEKSLFSSEIEISRQQIKGVFERRMTRKSGLPFRSLRRYLRCIVKGANPFHCRNYIPVDLGAPGR